MLSLSRWSVVLLLLIGGVSAANASPVTAVFEGSGYNPRESIVSFVSGFYAFESVQPDLNSDPRAGAYQFQYGEVRIDNHVFLLSPAPPYQDSLLGPMGSIGVFSDFAFLREGYTFHALLSGLPIDGNILSEMQLSLATFKFLNTPPSTIITSESIMVGSLPIEEFKDINFLGFEYGIIPGIPGSGSVWLNARVTKLDVLDIPAPATLLLLVTGLIGLRITISRKPA